MTKNKVQSTRVQNDHENKTVASDETISNGSHPQGGRQDQDVRLSDDDRFEDKERFELTDRFNDERFANREFNDTFSMIQPTLETQTPKPREGMVQRWVQIGDNGANGANQARRLLAGWLPRSLESIDKRLLGLNVQLGTGKSVTQGIYQVADMVLMEMPKDHHDKLVQDGKDRVAHVTSALAPSLQDQHKKTAQYGTLSNTSDIKTTQGRIPNIASD